ncbi:reticulon-4-like [Myxocyprinus asiaticus]|uniref:reticulon-4-like n=1 Tax=Myxocyprinus asiaticus TaxID=70543 RepID=UPI0022223C2C|nr:reticulon-4-like [Myxocyprinus asiaticus]
MIRNRFQMEEADKVSSTSADESPFEPLTNEVATVSQTQSVEARETMHHAEDLPHEIKEENITTQTAEENITPNELTITPRTAEITETPQISEETIDPSATEEPPQTTEITNAPQAAVETITPETTEVVTSTSQISEETITPQPTGETITSELKEVENVAPERAEITPSQIHEESITPAEVTSPQAAAEVSSAAVSVICPAVEVSSSTDVHTLHTDTDLTSEDIQKPSQSLDPSSYEPATPALFHHQFLSDLGLPPPVASQASACPTMDSFSKDAAGFNPDVLNQSDDDFMFEIKKSPFQAFSPGNDASDSLEEALAARRSVEVLDSPSPDLVQDAYNGDEDSMEPQEILWDFGSATVVSHSFVQQLASSDLFSNVNKESDNRPMSLPDILKSSPLNPDKMDSGSSEESPDFSPVHRSKNESPNPPFSAPASNPFGFDSKILLLKEMAEETETRAEEKAKLKVENISEQSFVAFDLVKEMDVPQKSGVLLKNKDDGEMSSQTFVQAVDKFECLNFPPEKAQQHSDSESPSADSFSPVLDAMAKNPSSFPIEQESRSVREEIEAIDEVSEQEFSSEEFEFVERPPRGTTNELLEMPESSAIMKPSEMLVKDQSPKVDPQVIDQKPAAQDANNQSSYHLLTQLSEKSSAVSGNAGLELDLQEMSAAPLIHSPMDTIGAEKKETRVGNMRAAAVLELVYWRDVRSSTVVLGCSLLILLSLNTLSIISVLSYLSLALLSITVSIRIYKGILLAIQKSNDGHPFKQYLEQDVALSNGLVQKYSDVTLSRINSGIIELRRLFLVEDLVDSLKFAVLLWILTYVGALFNGLTLLIFGLLGAFSCPIIYEKHQTQIEQYWSMVKNQLKEGLEKIQAKVPGMKKKSE